MANNATLIKLGIDLNKIPKGTIKKGEKGTWLNLDIWVNKEANEWGNNVSCHITQTVDESKSRAKKVYLGNGNVELTDGEVVASPKRKKAQLDETDDDLPF